MSRGQQHKPKHIPAYRNFPKGLRGRTVLKLIKEIPRTVGTMTLNEYQIKAKEFVNFPDTFTITYPALGLASEAGEVCDKIKKAIRDRKSLSLAELPDMVEPELGDVLWYVAILASNLGLELEDIATKNITKLEDRTERGVISGSGDNR